MRPGLLSAVVDVRFFMAEEGGRAAPVNSGYRVQVIFDRGNGAESAHDCRFDFRHSAQAFSRDGDLWLPLGVEDQALLAPFDADHVKDVLVAGTRFDVVEGRTRVGSGTVRVGLAVRH